ncbi:MAG TPA: ROK family protein [Verrucomicrobiae bacterium]|nr:ROK family protein [Verrucomicrobiae bacterium]
MRILVIDIGGSAVKALATGHRAPVRIPSGPSLTPRRMVTAIKRATAGWRYDAVSIGYPGNVDRGCLVEEAPNLGKGWLRFNFAKAFGCPVKIVNDAAMQALGSYHGGRMLFLGLGTGLGSALILDGVLHSMEFGDLPYRHGRTYADYLGKAALKRMGRTRWSRHAKHAVEQLKSAVQADYTVLGGGQAKLLKTLPSDVVLGDNSKAFLGGFRLWEQGKGRAAAKVGGPNQTKPGRCRIRRRGSAR